MLYCRKNEFFLKNSFNYTYELWLSEKKIKEKNLTQTFRCEKVNC